MGAHVVSAVCVVLWWWLVCLCVMCVCVGHVFSGVCCGGCGLCVCVLYVVCVVGVICCECVV